ncbi:MAG TPA: hypothetical protein VIO11_00770, partial [Candidatus Methanoperedens sp.]
MEFKKENVKNRRKKDREIKMKNFITVVSAILLFAVLIGIGVALTPPPPPPPPVPQSIGLYDTGIDNLQTTSVDQSAC